MKLLSGLARRSKARSPLEVTLKIMEDLPQPKSSIDSITMRADRTASVIQRAVEEGIALQIERSRLKRRAIWASLWSRKWQMVRSSKATFILLLMAGIFCASSGFQAGRYRNADAPTLFALGAGLLAMALFAFPRRETTVLPQNSTQDHRRGI